MASITLYGPPTIPYLTKVRSALGLKKLEYAWVKPRSQEDYRRWSPKTGQLPVIEIDGEWIEDSSRILDALDERFPNPPLLSADPKAAKSQRRLEQWVEAAFTFYWIHYLRAIADTGEAPPGSGGMADEFARRLDDLVNFLGGRPFFYSDEPSRADLAVHSFLAGIGFAVGEAVASEVNARPALRDLLERVKQATGVRRTDSPSSRDEADEASTITV